MPITASTIAAGVLANKTVSFAFGQLKSKVLEHCTNRRMKEFLSTFCDAINCKDEEAICVRLDEIGADEKKSESLFDAYRRINLSASPKIGPRIIALITAKAINEDRRITDQEQLLLESAERLSDEELEFVLVSFEEIVKHHKESSSGGWFFEEEPEDMACLDMDEGYEIKLRQLGFISCIIELSAVIPGRPLDLEELSEINNPRLIKTIHYSKLYGELSDYIRLVSK